MKFQEVNEKVKGVPFIKEVNARKLYDFIIKNKPSNVLELGVAHGTASCYIAAALDENGTGKLTCVDLLAVRDTFNPSLEKQIAGLELGNIVDLHRMQSGYNWFLHDEIKRCSDNPQNVCIPKYDLIIIDGPKNWTIDSSSFFLADKLLRENGWIIWDDYNWTYANAGHQREVTDGIVHRTLSQEELVIPHIKEIFHLLVMQHPNYGNFILHEEGDWVWAMKTKQDVKAIRYTTSRTFVGTVTRGLKRLLNKKK